MPKTMIIQNMGNLTLRTALDAQHKPNAVEGLKWRTHKATIGSCNRLLHKWETPIATFIKLNFSATLQTKIHYLSHRSLPKLELCPLLRPDEEVVAAQPD